MVNRIAYTPKQKDDVIYFLSDIPTGNKHNFVCFHADQPHHEEIALKSGYKYVGTKINTFSDIFKIYYKNAKGATPKVFPKLESAEILNIQKLRKSIPIDVLEKIYEKANQFQFANHYSNYNEDKSWSAISLVGYSKDFNMIEKPSEMNDEWNEEHKNEKFQLQKTDIYNTFAPEIDEILKLIPAVPHRVRLMKLNPQGGELSRHTDQTDKDLGITDGRLMRLHIPIKTNENVIFSSWNVKGGIDNVNMKVGEAWYLDIRKPHTAINGGKTERIHLVVDVESNSMLRSLVDYE